MSSSGTTATFSKPAPSRCAEHLFFGGMAGAAIVTAVAGFAPSLINTAGRRAPVTGLLAAHGIVCVAWLILLSTQIWLVASRRIAVHRALGVTAALLAATLIILGYQAAMTMVRRGFDLSGDLHVPPIDAAEQIVFALGDLLTFAVLLVAGYIYRRRSEIHKRLMLLATLGGLMPASLAHLFGHVPALSALPDLISLLLFAAFFFAVAVYDRISLGRVHAVSLWVPAGMLLWVIVRGVVIKPSPAWHDLLNWLAR